MKRIFTTLCIIYTIGYAINTLAQKALKGDVPNNGYIVTNETDTLQTVINRGGAVTNGTVTIDAGNLRTNTYGGLLTVLGKSIRSALSYPSLSTLGATSLGYETSAIGNYGATSLGYLTTANGTMGATAIGFSASATGNNGAIALGYGSTASNNSSFVWNNKYTKYGSHGNGTFNINPSNGISGVWIGERTLETIFDESKELHRDSATNVIWKTVWSNGWCWVIAYTNYPAN
jgi:hypothetical protein